MVSKDDVSMRVAVVLLAGLALLGDAAPARALPADRALTQYAHSSWQVRDGLPQNTVRAIAQTPDGYLWLGTEESLVRFDGVRFTAFDPAEHPGLVHNYVETLLVTRDGSLWIGTHKGLSRWRRGTFRPFTARDGLAGDVVRGLAEDDEGTLWVATATGLSRYRDGRFQTLTRRDGLPSENLTAVVAEERGHLWVATESAGLVRFERGRITAYSGCRARASGAVLSALRTRDGRLWVGTESGLCRLEGDRLVPARVAGFPSATTVWALHEDREGRLWIGAKDGVFRLGPDGVEAYTTRHGLTHDRVLALHEDREGNFWIGTDGGGLNQLRAGSFVTVSVPEGLASPHVQGLFEAVDGSLWVGTRGGGLTRFDRGRKTVYTTRDGLASDDVRSLAQTRDGSLWIGTSAGLSRLRDGRFRIYTTRDGLPHDNVWVVYADSRDDVWVGTVDGAARIREGVVARYGTRDGMPAPRVWAILETRDGSLWFGGMATRLSRLRDGVVTQFGEAEGLPGPPLALHEDRHGTLWVGTGHSGLARFRDGRFQVVTRAHGLHDNLVVSIVEDDHERFWMTSNRGIFAVRRAELDAVADGRSHLVHSQAFGAADGMRSPECNGMFRPSSLRTRSGRLGFPTTDGAVSVDPEGLVRNPVAPAPIIEAVRFDGRERTPRDGLEVPPGAGDLEVIYTAPSFRAPGKVAFRYRLEGFDAGWVDAGTRRAAFYTRVPPGQYTFRVSARNEDGVWSDSPAAFSLRLAPRFYQTAWFRALAVLAALGILLASHAARLARLRGRQAERVRLMQERELELARRVEEAMAEVKVLSGLLPICAGCKKIRDDRGYWNQIESFIAERSHAAFSHGICPDCAARLYPWYQPPQAAAGAAAAGAAETSMTAPPADDKHR